MLRVSATPVLALVLLCPLVAIGSEYHVAVLGDDHAAGSIGAPWRTLEGARDNLRRLRKDGQLQGPVTVFVHGGTYTLTAPLTLQREDSGTAEAAMTYRSWQDERVVLTGGLEVTSLAPFRGAILQADVSALNIPGSCRVLLWGGQRQEVARYPNRDPRDINGGEWTHVDGPRVSMYQDMPGYETYHAEHQHLDYWQRNVPELTRTLRMQAGDVREWAHPEDGEVSVFPRFNWRHYLLPIEALEREQRQLRLQEGSFYEIRAGDRYFVRNLREELDAPGEWFLDSRTATLYFWPPQPLADRPVSLAVGESLVQLEQCEHVIVHGFEMECCQGDAVVLRDCRHCRLSKNIIRGVGDSNGSGVCVVGGQANEVVGNDISFCGAHGISLSGGDVVRLELGGNVAENNYIHHVGQVGRSGKGIEVTGAGQRIAHNLIHDTPHSGIFMWGCHHVVEYNHLRHTCLESEDVGAIGGGAIDWLSWQATAIRYNFIHDTIGFGFDVESDCWRSPYFAWALYPDWAASGVRIVGNILARAPSGLIHLHSGRDNLVENNVLIEGGEAQLRLHGWTVDTGYWSANVERWAERYEAAAVHPAWQDLGTLRDPRAIPLADGCVMYGNKVLRNIFFFEDSGAAWLQCQHLPLDRHHSESNLIFHAGLPLRTGVYVVEEGSAGPNVLLNSDLEAGPLDAFPQHWAGLARATPQSRAVVTTRAFRSGQRSLEVWPGEATPGQKVTQPCCIHPGFVSFEPGRAYQFSAWLKTDQPGVSVKLTAFSWQENRHSWQVDEVCAVGPQWTRCRLLFRTPQPGETEYRPTMERLWCRISFSQGETCYWLDDVSLRPVTLSDEWVSWQTHGLDQRSLVADPRFVDPAQDNYALQPESPAWGLGFQALPMDRMGPYESPQRASWPIVEHAGARENGVAVPVAVRHGVR